MANSAYENPQGVLIFSVGMQEYSLDLNDVLTILTPEKFKTIAGGRASAVDSFKFNGRKTDIIQICGMDSGTKVYETSRLILIGMKSRVAGLWADAIKEVRIVNYEENKVLKEKLKKILDNNQDTIVKRVIKLDGKIILAPS